MLVPHWPVTQLIQRVRLEGASSCSACDSHQFLLATNHWFCCCYFSIWFYGFAVEPLLKEHPEHQPNRGLGAKLLGPISFLTSFSSTGGGLYQYSGFAGTGRLSVLVSAVISRKHIGKRWSSLKGRTSHRHGGHMWNHVPPSPKYQREIRDLWICFNLLKWKTDGWTDAVVAVREQCNSVVKLTRGTSNMSTHTKHHHPLLLLGSSVGNKRKADTLVRISQRTKYWYTCWCIC